MFRSQVAKDTSAGRLPAVTPDTADGLPQPEALLEFRWEGDIRHWAHCISLGGRMKIKGRWENCYREERWKMRLTSCMRRGRDVGIGRHFRDRINGMKETDSFPNLIILSTELASLLV